MKTNYLGLSLLNPVFKLTQIIDPYMMVTTTIFKGIYSSKKLSNNY